MAEEIRKVLNLSLGESPKNVRELKQDINELKTAIGDMVVAGQTGTTAYDNAVKLLGEDLRTLNTVQNATKKEVDALDGSYNALVQQMRELKAEWRATNNEAKRNELGKQILEINSQLKSLDYGVGNFSRNVGNYGNAWESLSGTLNAVQGAGSQFTSGLQAMSGVLGLTTAETNNMNESLGVMRGAVGLLNGAKGIAGLVKSLAAQRAATKAAAAEAKAETATLKQQAAATELVEKATTKASVATKVFKTALMSLGIGLVVVALGELAAHIDKVVGWFNKLGEKLGIVNPQTKELKKSNDLLNESIEAQNDALDKEVELMQAKGEDSQKVLQTQLKVIKAEILEAKSVNEKVKARIDELEVLGKRKGELKKLKEQYEKNNKTIEDLEHKEAVLSAKYDTEQRSRAKKAADDRAKAAQAAANAQAKADADAAAAAAKAREKAEETVNKIMEKGMTERESLQKEHTETLKNLEEARAHITTETYNNAVEAENAYYAKELAQILSDDYAKAYEEAQKKLNNKIESLNLGMTMTNGLSSFFGAGNAREEAKAAAQALKSLENYYITLTSEGIKLLNGVKDDLSPAAKEAFDILAGFDPNEFGFLEEIRNYYQEYLYDTEAFLKKYGEPFSTAIASMGASFKEYAQNYTEGIIRSFEAEIAQVENLADGGAGESAIVKLDEIWKKFAERLGAISPEAADSFKKSLSIFRNELQGSLGETFGASGAEVAERIKASYENILADLQAQIIHWDKIKSAAQEGTAEQEAAINAIAALEEDKRRITMKRDAEVFEARTRMYQEYSKSVEGLLGNVASAWQNTVKASVDSLNRELKEQVKAGKITQNEADKQMAAANERAEDSFEASKTLQYGVAAISTASAVIQALADPTVPSYILKAINAAAALAAGVAQMAQISATHFGSSGSKATSASAPKLVDRTPVVNTVSLNASEAGESVQQNMRVYVVESDITEAQERSRARVSESTF